MLTWASAFGAVANGVARVALGYLVDKMSFTKIFIGYMSIGLLISLTYIDAVHVPAIYFCLVLLNFVAYGAPYSTFAPAIMKLMGLKWGPSAYTLLLTSPIFASVANIVNVKVLKEAITIRGVSYLGSLTILIGIIISFFFREKRIWK